MKELADVLGESPGVAATVLQSDSWNEAPREAHSLLEKLRRAHGLRSELTGKLTPAAFAVSHADDAGYIERKASGTFGFLAFLDGRFRSIKGRWTRYRREGYQPTLFDQAGDLKQVDQLSALTDQLNGSDAIGRELFGGLWQGAESDLTRLEAYVVEPM
jgi:hypothetical protein